MPRTFGWSYPRKVIARAARNIFLSKKQSFWHKSCHFIRKITIFAAVNDFKMSNSRTINIKNPSRKLEEHIRKIGVQKYLWIEKLCSDETEPTKTIYVR